MPSPAPSATPGLSALGRFVDRLFQTFEDCRPGLPDATLAKGEDAVRAWFLELYEKELPRLADHVQQHAGHLSEAGTDALRKEVDRLARTVIVPAYVRTTFEFTPRERNDFFLTRDGLHGLERAAWTVGGIAVGGFAVWAPFIPLWSKEWVLPFFLGGLFLPELRRYLAMKRYERELNEIVQRADRELSRLDVAYLMREAVAGAVEAPKEPEPPQKSGHTPIRVRH